MNGQDTDINKSVVQFATLICLLYYGKCDIVVKFVNVNKQLETVKRSATYSY
jgi:hypothetical protein